MKRHRIARPGYAYELVNIECMPFSDQFNVIMEVEESLEPLLPFLAGTFPGCTYVHGSKVIHFMEEGHIVAIHPTTITITAVSGEQEAEALFARLFQTITEVQSRKDGLTPVFKTQPPLTVLDIFRALPQTNCGLCGSLTCMAFAARVHRREATPASCEPLKADTGKYPALR